MAASQEHPAESHPQIQEDDFIDFLRSAPLPDDFDELMTREKDYGRGLSFLFEE